MKLLVLLYADDTIVLSNTAAGLQKALDDLSNYCTEWKLQVNSGKTKVIIFSKIKLCLLCSAKVGCFNSRLILC